MTDLRYDDSHESRAMAQHRARKQAQAGAERSYPTLTDTTAR